jgi:hypothetical protein
MIKLSVFMPAKNNMKRLFIIIAGVVVLIGILVGAYFLFFAPKGVDLTVGNPFSGTQSGNVAPSTDLPTEGTVSNAGTTLAPQFVKITDGPVAHGSVAFDIQLANQAATDVPAVSLSTSSSASSTSVSTAATSTPDVEVRFIDRASGNVYSYIAHARTLTRISNKTLPGIQVASWTPDGSRVYAQFLASSGGQEQINTYAMDAKGGNGYLLDNNLSEAVVAGANTLFTLFPGSTGSVGTLSGVDGSDAHTLFSSVLSALSVHPTSGDLFATNKPSSQLDGYAFQISHKTGAFTRILGPLRGLSVLPSPDGSSLLYSYTDGGVYYLRVLNLATRASTALPVATLAEKCVWTADGSSAYCAVPTNLSGNLPDDWYQGATTFTDRIWKIDLSDRVARLNHDPNQVGKVNVDAVDLTLDPNESVLVFSDKHSGALYSYTL